MTTWKEFAQAAPHVAEMFVRRHAAAGNLCMLGTLRSDGFPRISPIEPRIFEGQLVIAGMPDTTKFNDLARDPRFCLHTATVDTHVKDGDVKLFGTVTNLQDKELHQRFAQQLFDDIGFDLRGQQFDQFYVADITVGSSVEVVDGHMDVTIWKPGEAARVVRKH
jgi:hypothetical protein